jgi:hypothetical protein
MECSCSVDVDLDAGDGSWSLYEAKTRKARKPHRCNECCRTIQPGEQYEHVKGLIQGDWFKHKTCADCLSVRSVFFNAYFYEKVWEDLRDNLNDWDYQVPEDCIIELTPAARAKVCELIETGWNEWGGDDAHT